MDVTALLRQKLAKLPPEKREAFYQLMQQHQPPQAQQKSDSDVEWLHAWANNVTETLTQHARQLDELRAAVAALRRDLGG